MSKNASILKENARIGIVNRGEAAIRFIRAVKDFNRLCGTRLETIAFCVDRERDALFAQEADEAHVLSSFSEFAGSAGSPYLNRRLIMEALRVTDCSALWAGWGFLSEDAGFVAMTEKARLVFLGPSSRAMALLGDKIQAKELAEKNHVPVCPWSGGPVKDLAAARSFAEKIGYPVIIKAANAGGGRGIRFVLKPEDLAEACKSAVDETLRITGNSVVFMERLVEKGRHMEVQVLADRHGNVLTFGVRDCSIQRKNQKIIEETPPPDFDPALMAEMEASAARLIKAAAYESAGTVEFLYDLVRGEFYFMEVNTRLQVEHPITEQLYGIDLVHGQIRIAGGENIGDWKTIPRGAVVEARLNAEDPDQDFRPAPGRVVRLKLPAGPGIRVDSGIEQGSEIPPDFDSMAAKIIACGQDRAQAIARLERALTEMRIKIEGGATNRSFLLGLLNNPEIRKGGVHTRFVEELLCASRKVPERTSWPAALAAAAVEEYLQRYGEDFANFSQQMFTFGSPRDLRPGAGQEVQISALGTTFTFHVRGLGDEYFFLSTGEWAFPVRYVKKAEEAFLFAAGKRRHVQIGERGGGLHVEIDGIPYEFETESGGIVKAPSPALVLSVPGTPGKAVEKGDVLLSLEAMKMEMIVPAPEAGIIREIRVKPGEQVGAGQILVVLEAASGERPLPAEPDKKTGKPKAKMDFSVLNAAGKEREWRLLCRDFYTVFAGFDPPPDAPECFDKIAAFIKENPDFSSSFHKLILKGISLFVAIESLFATGRADAENFVRLPHSRELLSHYFKRSVDREKGLPESFLKTLERVFALYNSESAGWPSLELPSPRPGLLSPVDDVRHLIFHIFRSRANSALKQRLLLAVLSVVEQRMFQGEDADKVTNLLDELTQLAQAQIPSLADAAINARYRLFDRKQLQDMEEQKRARVKRLVDLLVRAKAQRRSVRPFLERIQDLGDSSVPEFINLCLDRKDKKTVELALEALCRRMNRDRTWGEAEILGRGPLRLCRLTAADEEGSHETLLAVTEEESFEAVLDMCAASCKGNALREILIYARGSSKTDFYAGLAKTLKKLSFRAAWVCIGFLSAGGISCRTYVPSGRGAKSTGSVSWTADGCRSSLNPLSYRELRIYRLSRFQTELLRSGEGYCLFHCVTEGNARDERLMVFVEVSSTRAEFSPGGAIGRMVAFEKTFMEAIYALRAEQIRRRNRLHWNRIVIHIRPVLATTLKRIQDYASLLAARTLDLGIERLSIYCRLMNDETDGIREQELLFDNIVGTSFTLSSRAPSRKPMEPMDAYVAKVVRARQRNTIYPYEVIKMLSSSGPAAADELPPGEFEEFDLAESHGDTGAEKTYRSVKARPYGLNEGNIVFGLITNRLPDGRLLKRVIIISDPTADLGSLAEAECRRVCAALDMAEDLGLPAEFLPVSGGARIDMDSGTENLDWTASVLRRIIEYTQAGKELNIIVAGTNVGAQSYWNAEATMLMHTRGILIMTEDAAMLLTGKKALDFSGSVSAEDNVGIGGAVKIMEPNGQAQIRVKNLKEACKVLFRHYSLTYREPGRRWPERASTEDPADRDIGRCPYKDFLGQGFTTIGDIFSRRLNPERKKPFDIRQVMGALIDQDLPRLERWGGMRDAETAVIWEARIAGCAVGLIGIESRVVPRQGEIPYDGPENWSGGALFPLSSKKVARGINAFSGRLPTVLLANLSGFDGSPESLRKLQLEYGAEIGRAVVNFRGPFIFVVIARYHGGAYVVFSKHLNPNLHSVALEGAYASVIGGAPAAAVVFPSLVLKETYQDPQIIKAQENLKTGADSSRKDFEEIFRRVHAEKQTALAARFDFVHSVDRAKKVGSIDAIITVKELRPYIVKKIEEASRSM